MENSKLKQIAKKEIEYKVQDTNLWRKCLALTANDLIKAEGKYVRQRYIQLQKLSIIEIENIEKEFKTLEVPHKSVEEILEKEKAQREEALKERQKKPKKNSIDNMKKKEEEGNKKPSFSNSLKTIVLSLLGLLVIIGLPLLVVLLMSNKDSNDNGKTTSYAKVITPKKTNDINSLTIIASPRKARIRILNIKPKYYDGIKLKNGSYHIEVSYPKYETQKFWLEVNYDKTKKVILKKIKLYFGSKPNLTKTTLNFNELYYCLTERKMLDIMRSKINSYTRESAKKYDIYTKDYNKLCKDKRYYNNDYSDAKSKIDLNDSIINKKAHKRYAGDLYLRKKVVFSEKRPPHKTKILNRRQLLYCQSEIVRIKALNKDNIKQENYEFYYEFITDYKSRCSGEYYVTDLKHVKNIVKKNIDVLELEGRKRMTH